MSNEGDKKGCRQWWERFLSWTGIVRELPPIEDEGDEEYGESDPWSDQREAFTTPSTRRIGRGGGTRDPFVTADYTVGADDGPGPVVTLEDPGNQLDEPTIREALLRARTLANEAQQEQVAGNPEAADSKADEARKLLRALVMAAFKSGLPMDMDNRAEDPDASADPVDPDEAASMLATQERLPTDDELARDGEAAARDALFADVGDDIDRGDDSTHAEDDWKPMVPTDEPEIDEAWSMSHGDTPAVTDAYQEWILAAGRRKQRFMAAFAVAMLLFSGWFIWQQLPSSPAITPYRRVNVGAYTTSNGVAEAANDGGDTGEVAEAPSTPSPSPTPIVEATPVPEPTRTPVASPAKPTLTNRPTLVEVAAKPLLPLGPEDRQRLVRRHR